MSLVVGLVPSPLCTWVSPWELPTGPWGSGIKLKKDLEKGCPPGKDNISQRAGDSHLFKVLCLASPFTSSPCLECQRLFVLDWRRFRETFSGMEGILNVNHIWSTGKLFA